MICYIIAFWLVCGLISYGYMFAYCEDEYTGQRSGNICISLLIGAYGISGLLAVLCCRVYKHGWKLW